MISRRIDFPFAVALTIAAFGAFGAETLGDHTVRVRLTAKQSEITFRAPEDLSLIWEDAERSLPAGTYSIRVSGVTAAKQRFHLFIKTFRPSEANEAREYIARWKQQGYEPELVTFGKRLHTESHRVIDERSLWVSLARLDSVEKAASLKTKLEKQDVSGWIVPETIQRGKGMLSIAPVPKLNLGTSKSGKTSAKTPIPARIRCTRAVEVKNIDFGFWRPQRANRTYSGELEVAVGPDGLLEMYETLPVEDYLAGVLPAEMPAAWPVEALKAQAVSARSEVISSMAGKHILEGFNFCGTEHCRAYLGASGREKAPDRAVAETHGMVLVTGERVVPTVFSANCGGWTEDNECVWSAPPNSALRGVPDFPDEGRSADSARSQVQLGNERHEWLTKGLQEPGMSKWLRTKPPAYCCAEPDNFRWVRRFTARELSDIVNRKYPVGNIRGIELGDRGAGGRLKWVKIVGGKGTQVVRKELNIRLAFGGLNSAMFIIDVDGKKGEPTSFTFIGGGRGHGVGLCQDGARARALAGAGFEEILKHYFSRSDVVRMQ